MELECKKTEWMKLKKFLHKDLPVHIQVYSKDKDRSNESTSFLGKLGKSNNAKLIKMNRAGMEIGMAVNRCDDGRSAENVTEIIAVFADFDSGKMTEKRLRRLPIPPHAIVNTSPGKFHAYWLVKDCEVKRFKPIQKALAAAYGADLSVCDPARVMRLPGTINWKRDEPFLVTLVHLENGVQPISIDWFIKKMGLEVPVASDRTDGVGKRDKKKPPEHMQSLHVRIVAALKGVPADDRWLWLRFGMAIHSADCSEAGYDIWTAWSRTSSKFDPEDQRKHWDTFKENGGINVDTLYYLANSSKKGDALVIDEMSVAPMFVATSKQQLRYDRDNKEWLYFAGVAWKVDAQAPLRVGRKFIEALSQGEKRGVADSLQRFRSAAGLRNIASHAELLEEIHVSRQEFDSDPNLLAVENGVIDLSTGAFRVARPNDYLCRQASVSFEADASCPFWEAFMRSITREDQALCDFLRRALGYTLFGDANLQLFFMVVGSGGNGKGVMMRTVQKILGDYAQSIAPNLLTSAYSGNANGPTPALAKLNGARMVVCSEMPSGRRFDEAFIKQFAGGDEITARANYGNVFSFKPEGKLWLSTNEIPEILHSDVAMWRRLKPIPFTASFKGEEVDDQLEKKFAAEYPGILNWLLRGAQEFAAAGLGSCEAIEKLDARMRKEADSVRAWLSECCMTRADEDIPSGVAYKSYWEFMRRCRRKPISAAAFLASLEKKGFVHKRRKTGNFFEGFCLQPDVTR